MSYIFVGPTLNRDEALRIFPGAMVRPPVAQGDIWRAAQQRPHAIGIIDGYFERMPAVWHKEILWAMSQGIHVYGAASMGALRAAELAPHGMVGVGEIYEAFQSGTLERDDEVAVMHGEADSGYRRLSVALVDVRATLRAALSADILAPGDADLLLEAATARHYPERRWPSIVSDVVRTASASGLDRFLGWLPGGEVSQKADDARAMLSLMKRRQQDDSVPKSVSFEFEHTYFWSEACRQADRHESGVSDDSLGEALLDELRLLGAARYEAALAAASARFLASEWARERGLVVSDEQARAAWADWVMQHALHDAERRKAWCDAAGLEPLELLQWMRREATYRHALRSCDVSIRRQLSDALRAAGEYPTLLERARRKQAESTLDGPEDKAELLRWHYEQQLGGAIPELQVELSRLGLSDEDVWLRILARERAFLRQSGTASSEHRAPERPRGV